MEASRALLLLLLLLPPLLAADTAVITPGNQPSCPPPPAAPGRSTAAHSLHHDLFCGYEKEVLPLADATKKMEVTVNVWLHSVDINEYYHETLEVNTWILMNWTDDYLPWDPNRYDGIQIVRPSAEQIWTPVFITADQWMGPSLQAQRPTEECVVNYKGDVECMWPATFSLACYLEYALWPFDSQRCEFALISVNDNSSRLSLDVNNHSLTTWMLENPEWEVVRAEVERRGVPCMLCRSGEETPLLRFHLSLRRRAVLYLAAVSVPAFGLALMTLLPYLLPPSLPQRSLLAATGVLAHILILQVIASTIYGPAGIHVPPIVLLLRDSLLLCAASAVVSAAHRWLTSACPQPPPLLRTAATSATRLWAAGLSFARLQVAEAAPAPSTPAAEFWLQLAGAVDVCALVASLVAYVIMLARFLP